MSKPTGKPQRQQRHEAVKRAAKAKLALPHYLETGDLGRLVKRKEFEQRAVLQKLGYTPLFLSARAWVPVIRYLQVRSSLHALRSLGIFDRATREKVLKATREWEVYKLVVKATEQKKPVHTQTQALRDFAGARLELKRLLGDRVKAYLKSYNAYHQKLTNEIKRA